MKRLFRRKEKPLEGWEGLYGDYTTTTLNLGKPILQVPVITKRWVDIGTGLTSEHEKV